MKRTNRNLLLIFCILLMGIAAFYLANYPPAQPTQPTDSTKLIDEVPPLTVHFIDVGQADCILIQSPNGQNMLIDAGNNTDAQLILDYLRDQKTTRLDVVIGTHPHEDHIGALDTVITNLDIDRVYLPKASSNTKTFRDLLQAIKDKGLTVKTAKAGVTISLDPLLQISMLAPNSEKYQETNDYSAVIKLNYNNISFLFTGDAEAHSETEILQQNPAALKANILKVGHHGSRSSTSLPFLKAVAPEYAIISAGTNNSYGHPHQETLARLEEVCTVYRTDRHGTVVMKSDGLTLNIKTEH